MKQILHILKYKFKAYIRPDSKISSISLIKSIGSGIIFSAFAVGAFFFSKALIHFLLVRINIGQFLLHEFISMVLFIFFMSINIGNIIVSYSTLYKSGEVNYLFTKPVEPAKIFTIKFLDNFFYSSSTLLMILFSLLLGYAFYFELNIIQSAVLVFNFIPFMVSAGSFGVIILLSLLLLANKFGVKRVIYIFGTIYAAFIILFFRINSPRQLVISVLRNYPIIDKDIYLGDLIPSVLKILPNNWLSQTAYRTLHNDMSDVIYYTLLQVGLASLLFTFAYQLGKKYYFHTWLLNHKLTAELNSKKQNITDFYNKNRTATNQIKAIFRKDYFCFIRETSQVIHSLILLFLLTVFIVSVSGIKFVGLGNFYLQTMIYLAIFIFNLLLITTLSLRFVFPLISLEGMPFWKLKSSPISIQKYIMSKVYVPMFIITLVSIVLSLFSNHKFGSMLIIFSVIATVTASITIVSINFGMGCLFSNYKEKNPIRVSSSQGATLSFLISIIYMLFLIILLFKPFSEMFLSIMLKKNFNLQSMFYFTMPMLFVSGIIIGLFYKAAVTSLKRDF